MYITLKLLQNVSSKKKLYVIEGKKYVSVTLKLLENISSKKKLCVIEEEIMFQSIKKKDIFCSRFQYFIGDGAIFFNLPPLSEFFLPTFVSFDSKCNICQSPKLTSSFDPPPPTKLELYLCIGQIFIKR